MTPHDPLHRHPYPHTDPIAARLLTVLLAQDGSTTKLVSAIAGEPASLHIYKQARVEHVPHAVLESLGGETWLERITSLHVNGNVLMDNLTFTRMDRVPTEFSEQLERGELPVGRLLETLFVRRHGIRNDEALERTLFAVVGQPDIQASRVYTIDTRDGPFMLVFETYRAAVAAAFVLGAVREGAR